MIVFGANETTPWMRSNITAGFIYISVRFIKVDQVQFHQLFPTPNHTFGCQAACARPKIGGKKGTNPALPISLRSWRPRIFFSGKQGSYTSGKTKTLQKKTMLFTQKGCWRQDTCGGSSCYGSYGEFSLLLVLLFLVKPHPWAIIAVVKDFNL